MRINHVTVIKLIKSPIFILNWSWMESPQLINFDQFQIDSVYHYFIIALAVFYSYILDGNPDCAKLSFAACIRLPKCYRVFFNHRACVSRDTRLAPCFSSAKMDDFRWENRAIRVIRTTTAKHWGNLTKKLIVYYEARDTAVNIWGLSGFSVEILKDRVCDNIQGDRNKM